MLVDNPKRLIRSLCLLGDRTFTAEAYRPVLASFTKKGRIHEKTRDTYFYMANILSLIKKTSAKSHTYIVTPICKKICQVIDDESRKPLYEKYLRGLLLGNKDKGPLFREFINHTSEPKNITQVENEFGKVPTKTLIAFCLEAGLIVRYRGFVKSVERKSLPTIPEFYSSLVKIYKDLQVEAKREAKMIYIPIDLIRDMVSLELGLGSPNAFDALLEKTLDSQLGVNIYLHGAPPQVDFAGFFYKERRYAYLSVRPNNEQGD